MNLKQSILKYEKNKKPRDLLGEIFHYQCEVSHYKALSRAMTFYAVSSTIFLITLLLLK